MAKTEEGETPVNLDILAQLETLCQAPLPSACRALYTDYPEILRRAVRADDGSDTEGFVSEAELLADPAEVLNINREVRGQSILDPEGREFLWPVNFLVIGETGDGDYYCVDAAGEFDTVAQSMEEFHELLVECFVTGIDAENEDEFDDDEFEDDEVPDDEDADIS
jgi:hypothetical protein